MRAVQLTALWNPVEGLKYVDIPAPDASRPEPGPDRRRVFSHPTRAICCLAQGIYACGLRCQPSSQ